MRIYMSLLFLIFTSNVFATNLVFIHSYHFAYPWVEQYRSGFMSTVDNVKLYEFEMDTKRRPSNEFSLIADQAWQYIMQNSAEIVVLADDNALRLLGPRLVKNQIPTVFLGINGNPRDYIELTTKISGALERPLMKRSVSMLKGVLPGLQKVLVLMDNTVTSDAILLNSFSNLF